MRRGVSTRLPILGSQTTVSRKRKDPSSSQQQSHKTSEKNISQQLQAHQTLSSSSQQSSPKRRTEQLQAASTLVNIPQLIQAHKEKVVKTKEFPPGITFEDRIYRKKWRVMRRKTQLGRFETLPEAEKVLCVYNQHYDRHENHKDAVEAARQKAHELNKKNKNVSSGKRMI
jgi:hypothetical protein